MGSQPAIRRSGRVAAIGEETVVGGFALAGVQVHAASTQGEARRAWAELADDVVLVVLSESAARGLQDGKRDDGERLTVVVPS